MSDSVDGSESDIRIGLPTRIRTNVRTNERTERSSYLPGETSSSVTRTRAYANPPCALGYDFPRYLDLKSPPCYPTRLHDCPMCRDFAAGQALT